MGYRKKTGWAAIAYALERLDLAANDAAREGFVGCAKTHRKAAKDARLAVNEEMAKRKAREERQLLAYIASLGAK